MSENNECKTMEVTNVWVHAAKGRRFNLEYEWGNSNWYTDEAIRACRNMNCDWEIEVLCYCSPSHSITIAQSRTDTPGTMARLYAAGEMGSAPPLASYLAGKATVDDSEVTP